MDMLFKTMASVDCAATVARNAIERKAAQAVEDVRSGEMDAQAMTEYAVIVAFLAVTLIAVIILFRNQISTTFTKATTALSTANTANTPGTIN